MSFRVSKFESCPIEGSEDHNMSAIDIVPEDEKEEVNESRWRRLVSLLTSSPFDLFLMINEHFESVDWDSKATSVARPTGNVLTMALYVTRLCQDNLIKPNVHNIGKKHDAFDLSKSKALKDFEFWSQIPKAGIAITHLDWYWELLRVLKIFLRASLIGLVIMNLFVTYKFLLGRYQTYSLFYCKSRPRSKNVIKRSLSDLSIRYMEDVSRSSLWAMITFIFLRKRANTERQFQGKTYYQLQKWTPGKFYAALFSTFSPICFIFLMATDVTFKTAIPVLIHQYLSFLVIFERYESRLDDEACLSMANQAEIHEKVIKPKTAIRTQDAMVDATQHGGRSAVFFPSFTTTRSHIFQTHTLTGDVVTERYNPATEFFEDVENSGFTKNYVNHDSNYMLGGTPRDKAINGASIRPMFWSRQPSPNKIGTPPKFMPNGASPSSAPLTPNLKPLYGTHNDVSIINTSGLMNRGDSANRDIQLPRNNNYSRLRRNSASPIKSVGYMGTTGMRNSRKPLVGGDSSISFSMEVPNVDIPFEEVAQRGRRTYHEGNLSRDVPASRSSALSSRHSSVSPFKGSNLSYRRDSGDSRPPFR
ncbi:LANO_0G18030g1_1 [Lachancea nothofagi CBS 11611]|uniref:Nuclear rim protein 1 n=1 Tax=Lachancea nothofagi CBS 11611 TaxID=1266666 RepID=A0A1G4KKT2_9SACH|nr:LANO_0G18030g1_1 [Lachancea nothofagi CBS 11611]